MDYTKKSHGDCVVGNSDRSSSINNHVSALTQSPAKNHSVASEDKLLIKGVGYTVIYKSEKQKMEISAKGTFLRRTKYKNGKKTDELLYEKISDKAFIQKVENFSSNWKGYDAERQQGYVIREQLNADGKPNGIFKVVESSKVKIRRDIWGEIVSIDSNIDDWTYYKRRRI